MPFVSAKGQEEATEKPRVGEQPLAQLFRRYSRALKIFVRNAVKNEQVAEEIVQETYLRVLEKQQAKALTHARAYLFRTAQNLAIDYLRRGALNVIDGSVVVEDDVMSSAPSPEELTTYRESKQLLNQSLAELPVDTCKVFYYRRYRHWPIANISEEMGISERMVYRHMEAALKHLAGKFGLKPGEVRQWK